MSCLSKTKFSRIDPSLLHRCGDHYDSAAKSCPKQCQSNLLPLFWIFRTFTPSDSTVRCIFDCDTTCTDICGYNSYCVGDLSTPSSVQCECEEGFWSPTADNKSCRRTLSSMSDLTCMAHLALHILQRVPMCGSHCTRGPSNRAPFHCRAATRAFCLPLSMSSPTQQHLWRCGSTSCLASELTNLAL